MIRTKGEAGTGDIVEAVRHMRSLWSEIRRVQGMRDDELWTTAKDLQVPIDLLREVKRLGKLPVVNFSAGGVATPADGYSIVNVSTSRRTRFRRWFAKPESCWPGTWLSLLGR